MPVSNNSQISHFPLLILNGRPASGKSEIIDFLNKLDQEERLKRFRIADLDVLDDFPMLFTWFEEDRILEEEFGMPRLHTDSDENFKFDYLWDLLIKRLELEYQKRLRDIQDYHQHTTTIIEFSRGSEHGGYTHAFQQFSKDLLKMASVLYVEVSFAESLRKNRQRFNPERPDSILEHALPDRKLEHLYRDSDWDEFCSSEDNFLQIGSLQVPFEIFKNEDDVTSGTPFLLGERLEESLQELWKFFRSK